MNAKTAAILTSNVKRLLQAKAPSEMSRASVARQQHHQDKMRGWQIHSYGGVDELKLSCVRTPIITRPNQVLVRVNAASVNPIDVAMIGGYGTPVFNLMRTLRGFPQRQSSDIEFPLILGRDFAGTVASRGHNVDNCTIGQQVWGVVPIEQQGSHAEYVLIDSNLVRPKPTNLTDVQAASILYAGLTAWSALWYTGGLCYDKCIRSNKCRRVLVLGGSGGVGTLAIQLLKAWNMHVVTTCSSDAVKLLEELMPDSVVNYQDSASDGEIVSLGPYDIILDCCNLGLDRVREKKYPHNCYITLNSPLLSNIDQHGLGLGLLKNVGRLVQDNIPTSESKGLAKWGFFVPSPQGIDEIQKLVECEKILPVVQHVYKFEDLPKAYETVSLGHLRGKTVIDMR